MLNLNTICCFCCRWCGWMRYCFCLPKLRKWNKGGNSGSARRGGEGGGLEGVLSPHSRPFFATNPYPELLSSFSWKPFSFPISGGSTEGPPLYLVQTEARKKIAFETPPPYLKVWIRHCAAIPLRRFWRIPLPEWRSNPGSREYPFRPW